MQRFIVSGLSLFWHICCHICNTPSSNIIWVVSKVQNTGMTNQSPTLPSQLIIVIITNHDKFNFCFRYRAERHSNQLHYSHLAEQQSILLQLSGRTEVAISNKRLRHNNSLCYSYLAAQKLNNWLQHNNHLCHSYLAEWNWLLLTTYCILSWINCYGLVVAGITKASLMDC